MATPFRRVDNGINDGCNFFHSQVCINIKCAFEMLVKRFRVLQKALPENITIAKTSVLVRYFCILHNFCFEQTIEAKRSLENSNNEEEGGEEVGEETEGVLETSNFDKYNIVLNGGISFGTDVGGLLYGK